MPSQAWLPGRPDIIDVLNTATVQDYAMLAAGSNYVYLVTLGHHSKIWSQGQRTYVLVSSRPDADLTRAASYVMRQMP